MILSYKDYVITGTPQEIKEFINLMENKTYIGYEVGSNFYDNFFKDIDIKTLFGCEPKVVTVAESKGDESED